MAGKALFERRRQYAGWKWNRSGIAGTDTLAVRLLRRSGYLPDSQREKGKLEAGSRGKAGKKRASLRSSIFRDDCGNALLLFIWLICPYAMRRSIISSALYHGKSFLADAAFHLGGIFRLEYHNRQAGIAVERKVNVVDIDIAL